MTKSEKQLVFQESITYIWHMPIDPLTGALITTGLQAGSQALANNTNRRLARDQRTWAEDQWHRESNWNLAQWNRTNEYNSPQAQMARFKEAGLNPHLIYGKGTSGNAQNVTAPDTKSYSRSESKSVMQGLDTFGKYVQFKQMQAQTNNVQSQTAVNKQQAFLTAQKAIGQAIGNNRGKLDYGIARDLRETQIEAAKVNLANQQQSLRQNTSNADVLTQTQQTRVKQIEEQFKNEVKKGKNYDLDALLKQYEAKLNEAGLQKTDDLLLRWIASMDIISPKGLIKGLKDKINY